jgi:hypothetical protein
MRKHLVIASSTLVAGLVAGALLLRPHKVGPERLAAPAGIPPAARQVLRSRMQRHGDQMRDLVLSVVLSTTTRSPGWPGKSTTSPCWRARSAATS